MKKLLPLLLFLLPIVALSQETQGWSRDLPHGFQVLATQDGHFMVLGSKTETVGDVVTHTPYLARYSADGELVYERYYSRASTTSLQATKMDLMSNGDLWVTGRAHKADGSEYHLLSRISPASGDTLYMRLYPNTGELLDFYLQLIPGGDRFYQTKLPYGGDVQLGNLEEITENFELVKEHEHYIGIRYGMYHPFAVSSPGGHIFIKDTYQGAVINIGPDGKVSHKWNITNSDNIALVAPINGGGGISVSRTHTLILNANLETVSEIPYASYTPILQYEWPKMIKIATDGFLVGSQYESNYSKYSPALLRLDNQGNMLSKHAYPEAEDSDFLDLAASSDGEAVLLLENKDGVRLVKTGGQGQVLSAKEEMASSGRVSLYPNPVQTGGKITLDLPAGFTGELHLFDQTGRLQLEKHIRNSNNYQLTLPQKLAPGMYHIRLKGNRGEKLAIRFIRNRLFRCCFWPDLRKAGQKQQRNA